MKWYFEDFIYGSIDGAVTTFVIVAGVVGARIIFYLLYNKRKKEQIQN